ncbi:MAG: hypothetical protein GEU82_04805 [Luteitalea sp.]|nr:hypothetical protein [Luteitalea sp.]
MARPASLLASAAIAGSMILAMPTPGRAQSAVRSSAPPGGRLSPFAQGSIVGIVQDDNGSPVGGVVVTALGATTTFAVTTNDGRFEFGPLAPGPYLVRAHLSGYAAPRTQTIQVRASGSATRASVQLRRAGTPVLAAGIGVSDALQDAPAPAAEIEQPTPPSDDDDHRELAWRLRHARRGVLKDVSIPDSILVEADDSGGVDGGFLPADFFGRAVGSPARAATNFFADTAFSGQVNLLTTGSFDTPQQLFSADSVPRHVAFVRLGAPVGDRADWTVSGALTQADISSWIVAGAYTTRTPGRHGYDIGLSYSTQRYDGGNPLVLRDAAEGSRNAATIYAYDSLAITPALTVGYGAAYARYDYLEARNLFSPRFEVTVSPTDRFRVNAQVSRRALAPGAEEFLPRGDEISLPPQRTFSTLESGERFEAERTAHMALGVERDFGASTIGLRVFRQEISDQLVALFGQDMPEQPSTKFGHYLVGNAGDAVAAGCRAEFRTVVAGRVHGSVAYSFSNAQLTPAGGLQYVVLLAASAVRPATDRVHDLATRIETTIPETATRVLVLYRLSNGFAQAAGGDGLASGPAVDGRFDVQVRQSLPFMNFSNAKWEMLFGVRNFFRESASDQSVYDELLVVRPPKRVVGGVTLLF